jgi:anti-anti-sigma factor
MHDTQQLLRLPADCTATTRDDLRERGLRAIADARRAVVPTVTLEARGVTAFDAAGLGVLLLLEKRAAEAGVRLHLQHPSPIVVAVLRATGLAGVFGADEAAADDAGTTT